MRRCRGGTRALQHADRSRGSWADDAVVARGKDRGRVFLYDGDWRVAELYPCRPEREQPFSATCHSPRWQPWP
jgi:hypothetical protein